MIEDIQKNIEIQIKMLAELANYQNKLAYAQEGERTLLNGVISSLQQSMKIISDALPEMIQGVSVIQPLGIKTGKNLEKVAIVINGKQNQITLNKGNKEDLLKELRINEEFVRKFKRAQKIEVPAEPVDSRAYYKFSNKVFSDITRNLIAKNHFKDLKMDLQKSNMNVLLEGYVSMMFMSSLISFFLGIFLMAFLLFFNINLVSPYITAFEGNFLIRMSKLLIIPIAVPLSTFFFLYWYPSTEKKSIAHRIEQELPFAVVHMGAISGSGVEPVSIFRIIATGKDYPHLRKEIRKILNQINLYGYDVITALNNTAKNSPSTKLAELLTGISVTINSGGELKDYFEKRSESLVNEYRLSREKYTKVAETSMDLYITVVIAAPMVLLLVFILLSINPELGVSISPQFMTLILILIIGFLNVIFLTLLHLKQPGY